MKIELYKMSNIGIMKAYFLGVVISALKELIPAQHSAYWYNARKYRVGASEIAVYIGQLDKNYANIVGKLREKVFTPIGDNVNRYIGYPAVWGNILEDVARVFCEHTFRTVIHEIGSIPNLPGQSMSPDGLSVVDDDVVLWEFKCPTMRQITQGKMPRYYLPQVLTGLETFSFCDYANFMEFIIKRCSLDESGSSYKFDYKFPFTRYGSTKYIKHPLTWGAISFMAKKKEIDKTMPGAESFDIICRLAKDNFIDFGSCPKDIMEHMMNAFANKFIDMYYIYQQFPDADTDKQHDEYSAEQIIADARDNLDGRQLLGVMRWKMIEYNLCRVERRVGYLAATNRYARIVNECVEKCDMMENNAAKEAMIQSAAKEIKTLLINDRSVDIIEDYVE